MTAQVDDKIRYKNSEYSIIGINGEGLLDPSQYGLSPTAWVTSCWRGFLTTYVVENKKLFLTRLEINLTPIDLDRKGNVEKVSAPLIEGYKPKDTSEGEKYKGFEYKYNEMKLPIPFTGGLLVASGFIRELYIHMGFHPAWKYEDVHELIFEKGNLFEARDVSREMAEFREEMLGASLRPDSNAHPDEIMKWIEQCFSRDYSL
jgi:hypothetical protein